MARPLSAKWNLRRRPGCSAPQLSLSSLMAMLIWKSVRLILVRDAARLARYGGVEELRDLSPHTIDQLFFYAVTPEAEPTDLQPVLIDISAPEILAVWTAAMEAHGSQTRARNYVELQLLRARVNGLRAGLSHAVALYPNDPLVLDSLAQLNRSARRF